MLNNNGYIVKDLVDNEDSLIIQGVYRGLQSYHNWPLEKEEDYISKEITKSTTVFFEEHFAKYGYEYEIITDIELLKDYVNHCNKLQLATIVMKIMSIKKAPVSNGDLKDIEILGYDCMATECESYLAEIHTVDFNNLEPYKRIRGRTNSNGLLNTYEEVEDFIKKRNELLKSGLNLENYWEPIPVRLSIVEI